MDGAFTWKSNMTPESKDLLKKLSEAKPMILSSLPEVDMLGYKSPIEVIVSDMVMKEEDQVMQAVWNVGVNVDKAELVRALAYDRNQYAAGYLYAKGKYERPHGEWIPCSERLPEKNGRYLTSCVSNLTNRYYIDSIFFAYGEWDCCNGDVEAWMPLPEPYMEGGDEK